MFNDLNAPGTTEPRLRQMFHVHFIHSLSLLVWIQVLESLMQLYLVGCKMMSGVSRRLTELE